MLYRLRKTEHLMFWVVVVLGFDRIEELQILPLQVPAPSALRSVEHPERCVLELFGQGLCLP